MTKIEELEAQLKKMREQMTKIEREIENEKAKPIVRATQGGVYHYVEENSLHGFHVKEDTETAHHHDCKMFESGNYYLDKNEAQLVADMFKYVTFAKMFIRQNSKDKINWKESEYKPYIVFEHETNKFKINGNFTTNSGVVYFPTRELAQEFIDEHESYLEWMKH